MLISDAFRCALLTITIAGNCAQAESNNLHQDHGISVEKTRRQIVKRDAVMVFKHYPVHAYLKHGPKLIYKRIWNPRLRSPKPANGVVRTRRRPANPSKKVMRKYRKSVNPKYDPPRHHKRPPKISYANPKNQNNKPQYSVLKRSPSFFDPPAPVSIGFGEPPDDFQLDYNFLKTPMYGKLPGGERPEAGDGPLSIHKLSDPIDLDNRDYSDQELKKWRTVYLNDFDDNFSEAKTEPPPPVPKAELQQPAAPVGDKSTFSNVYEYEKRMKMDAFNKRNKNRKRADGPKQRYGPHVHNTNAMKAVKSAILLGGHFAEPPGRYGSRHHSAAPMFDDFALPEAAEPDVASPEPMPPQANYKNCNLAFSPHNTKDALSMAD